MRLWMSIGAVAAAGAIAATGALGSSGSVATGTAAVKPTLAVVVIGGGRVASKPAGISCPGKCKATFKAGTRVVLTPTAKKGSRFLRWGGNCSGTRACRVKVSALSAVAAQFVGPTTKPPPPPSVEAGTYEYSNIVSLYVPAGARSVQNFYVWARVNCAGGGGYVAEPKILTTTIKQNRSFTARTSERAVVGGANATITSAVTGYFQGPDAAGKATAAGVYRVDIVFADTPDRRCTSNDQPWTATRTGG